MHWETVTPLLRELLEAIMRDSLFNSFRLVGGTALSLQRGHRMSVDIDMFTDALYGSVDINPIDKWFRERFNVVDTHYAESMGIGVSFFVGQTPETMVKVDIYYTDKFISDELLMEGIRLADQRDIAAMKIGMAGQGARKKDFWDIHELHDEFSIDEMIQCYKEREPYGYSEIEIRKGLTDFALADDDFTPLCLRGKFWELIKYDIVNWVKNADVRP